MVGPISGGVSPLQGGQGPQDPAVTPAMLQFMSTVVQAKDANGNGVKEALQNIAQAYQGTQIGNEAKNAMHGKEDDFTRLKDNLLISAKEKVLEPGASVTPLFTVDQSLSLIQTFVQPAEGGLNYQINIDIQQYDYSHSSADLAKIQQDLKNWIPEG